MSSVNNVSSAQAMFGTDQTIVVRAADPLQGPSLLPKPIQAILNLPEQTNALSQDVRETSKTATVAIGTLTTSATTTLADVRRDLGGVARSAAFSATQISEAATGVSTAATGVANAAQELSAGAKSTADAITKGVST